MLRRLLKCLAFSTLIIIISCSSEEENKKKEQLEKKFQNKNLYFKYHSAVVQPGMPPERHDLTNHVFTFHVEGRDFLLVTKGGSSGGLDVIELSKKDKKEKISL